MAPSVRIVPDPTQFYSDPNTTFNFLSVLASEPDSILTYGILARENLYQSLSSIFQPIVWRFLVRERQFSVPKLPFECLGSWTCTDSTRWWVSTLVVSRLDSMQSLIFTLENIVLFFCRLIFFLNINNIFSQWRIQLFLPLPVFLTSFLNTLTTIPYKSAAQLWEFPAILVLYRYLCEFYTVEPCLSAVCS